MRLYTPSTTDFSTLGLGILGEALTATVKEDRNGEYLLKFTYPMTGVLFDYLRVEYIVTAKHNPYEGEQPFRIYKVSKPLNGIVTVECHHVSYDLSFIPISPFHSRNIYETFQILNNDGYSYIETSCPFTFYTDKQSNNYLNNLTPSSIRSLMAGREGSVVDRYGGEWEFDGWHCSLLQARGRDNNVTIEYGKNLTKMTENVITESMASGVYPYWYGDDGELVVLPEKIMYAEGVEHTTVRAIDFTDKFQQKPTEEELRERCQRFIEENDLANPYRSISVDFVSLDMTDEYRGTGLFEQILLCDIITVKFQRLGVSTKAKVVGLTYDVMLDRYTNVDVGQARSSIADTIASQARALEQPYRSSAVTAAIENAVGDVESTIQQAVTNATQLITGNLGGYIVLLDNNSDGKPEELLILADSEDYTTANQVWRWNSSGLGYSSTGYNGTYATAMTSDGQIVADFITTGVLNADLIKAGHLDAQYVTVGENRELGDYFTVATENGVVTVRIGDSSSGMVLKQTGSKIAFCNSQGDELAYWTNNEFILTDLTSQMRIGSTLIRPQNNGSLSFVAAT